MLRIALVEDSPEDRATLKNMVTECLRESFDRKKVDFTEFSNPVSLLENYRAVYDLVFLDIQTPMMDGMTAAQKLRALDPEVPLIFVTNMARYAVRGDDVNALGFVLKPVVRQDLFLCLRRAVAQIDSKKGTTLTISSRHGIKRVRSADVCFIESNRHMLVYHLQGETLVASGSIGELEEKLKGGFISCSRSYLVNPHCIQEIRGLDLTMTNGEIIPISRTKKKEFIVAFNRWLGEGNEI